MALLDLFEKTLGKQAVEKEEKALAEAAKVENAKKVLVEAAKANDVSTLMSEFDRQNGMSFAYWATPEESNDFKKLMVLGAHFECVKSNEIHKAFCELHKKELDGWEVLAKNVNANSLEAVLYRKQ